MRDSRAIRRLLPVAVVLLAAAGAAADLGPDDRQISLTGPAGSVDSDAYQPAVAFDAATQRYLVVWSADDQDGVFRIHGRLLSGAAGEPVSDVFLLHDALPADRDQRQPAVAWDESRGRYLVVWSADGDAVGAYEIFGRGVGADGALLSPPVRLSDMGASDADAAFDAVTPDVIWMSGLDAYAVAWAGDDDTGLLGDGRFEIYGQLVDAATFQQTGANDIRLSIAGPDEDLNDVLAPALADIPGTDRWLAVFEYDLVDNAVHDPEIVGTGVTGDVADGFGFQLSFVGGGFEDGDPARNPDLIYAGSSGEFFCVFDGLTATGRAVYGQRFAPDGTLIGNQLPVSAAVPPFAGGLMTGALEPHVAVDPWSEEWFVSWRGDVFDGVLRPDYEVWSCRFDDNGAPLDMFCTQVSGMDAGNDPVAGAGAPTVAFNGLHGYKLVAWAGNTDATPGGENEIFVQALAAGDGTVDAGGAPAAFALHPASPNPFNPSTVLAFDLPGPAEVSLQIYDAAGRRVRTLLADAPVAAGRNRATWNGRDDAGRTAPAGVYFYRLDSPFGRDEGRMTLVK